MNLINPWNHHIGHVKFKEHIHRAANCNFLADKEIPPAPK